MSIVLILVSVDLVSRILFWQLSYMADCPRWQSQETASEREKKESSGPRTTGPRQSVALDGKIPFDRIYFHRPRIERSAVSFL